MFWLLVSAFAQVATVNGVDIPEEDWSRRMARETPPITDEVRLEVVDHLVGEELMYQEAVRLGLERDPKVEKVMVNTLLREQVYNQVRNSDFKDEELEAYYEAHKDEFVVPHKRQIKTVTIQVTRTVDEDAALARLEPIREDIAAGRVEFKDAAVRHSQDIYQPRGGDAGFVSPEGKPGLDPAIVEAAFAMEMHDLSQPIRTDDGWVLVTVTNERQRVERTFQQMKGSVLRNVKNARLAELYDAYIVSLAAEATVQVDRAWAKENGAPAWATTKRNLGSTATIDGRPVEPAEPREGSTETPLDVLTDALENQLLLDEAWRQGLNLDPKVRKVIINIYLREHIYSDVQNSDFSDEMLRAFYDAHKEDFVVPEKVHLDICTVRITDERSEDQARGRAEEVLALVPARPFDDIAKEYSEDAYRRRGGDLGWVSAEGKPGVAMEIVEAGLGQPVGDFTLVRTSDAWVVVVTQDRREPVERTFEQMKGSVLRKVKNEELQRRYALRVAELAAQAEVQVHTERVLAMEAPAPAPGLGVTPPQQQAQPDE